MFLIKNKENKTKEIKKKKNPKTNSKTKQTKRRNKERKDNKNIGHLQVSYLVLRLKETFCEQTQRLVHLNYQHATSYFIKQQLIDYFVLPI